MSPNAFTGPFDAVIASYSLMMIDLRAALAKMHAVCGGRVHLFYPLTPPGGREVERALWPAIHGAGYPPEPMADCVWNVLFQMGILATLEAEFTRFEHLFRGLDEAVDEYLRAAQLPRRGGDRPPVRRSAVSSPTARTVNTGWTDRAGTRRFTGTSGTSGCRRDKGARP